jgi:hypothetical protein
MIADIAQREDSPAGGEPGAHRPLVLAARGWGVDPTRDRLIAACRAELFAAKPRALEWIDRSHNGALARSHFDAAVACLNFQQRVEPPWAFASALHAFLAPCCARPNAPLVR